MDPIGQLQRAAGDEIVPGAGDEGDGSLLLHQDVLHLGGVGEAFIDPGALIGPTN